MNLSALLANWRTTFFGSLFLFALYVTQYPDLLSAVFEPALAKKIVAWAALISGFVAFATSKDAAVSGKPG